uniref:Uncharacterized protein n=1 Tax=Arundo donax TaxID=35708 RepID=A0A0A9AYE3_ARUDO
MDVFLGLGHWEVGSSTQNVARGEYAVTRCLAASVSSNVDSSSHQLPVATAHAAVPHGRTPPDSSSAMLLNQEAGRQQPRTNPYALPVTSSGNPTIPFSYLLVFLVLFNP